MRGLPRLCLTEARLFLREPIAVLFSVAFPLMLLLVVGFTFGGQPSAPGYRVIDTYVPTLLGALIAYLGLMNVPIALSEYREAGVLRRYRVSPVALGAILSAHLLIETLVLVAVTALIVVTAALAFGLRLGGSPAALAVLGLAGAAALFGLGLVVGGLTRSGRAAQSVGGTAFFLCLFTSGGIVPRELFPAWLHAATDYLPLTLLDDALTNAWVGAGPRPVDWATAALMLALGFLAVTVALRTFRWS
jgi:ABC-2 type transport system permease protein